MIVEWYVDDAVSGTSVRGRDAYQRMKRDALQPNPPFNFILFYDLSRFSRGTTAEFFAEMHVFECNDVQVVSVNDPLMDGPFRDVHMAMLSNQSHQEVVSTSRKTIDGQLPLVKGGWWSGGTPPYGYDLEYVDRNGEPFMVVRYLESGKKQILDPDGTPGRTLETGETITRSKADHARLILSLPERVELVRRIFGMYIEEDLGFKSIAEDSAYQSRMSSPSIACDSATPTGPKRSNTMAKARP